jgi:dienelactone hydrolase/predicted GH43/DUF377 family glycosyl hydrolase
MPSDPRPVSFSTTDDVILTGSLYGHGKVAVIFSNMGDQHEDSWGAMPPVMADEGYTALTYEFRYWVNNKIDNNLAKFAADDLRAAIAFVREQGAEKVVLVGASLGGMATAKVAADQSAASVIIMGSPLSAPSIGLQVEKAELQAISAPKFFITSENDDTVDASALMAMFDLAVEPKQIHVYGGSAHGTKIFDTDNGSDLRDRLLAFIQATAPADGSTPPSLPTPTTAPALFTPYGDGPVVSKGQSGEWDDRFTEPGAVIFYDNQFHMFRNGFRDWPASVQIGYVTAPDGYTWTKQGAEPVLKTEDVPYAGVAALASSVIVEDDSVWVLYFYTWQSKNFPSAGGIGRATAPNPTGPWTVADDLVLKPGSPTEWDGSHILAPDVHRTDSGYVMYYSGYNRKGIQMIGRAESLDGLNWTKYNDPTTTTAPFAESDPVLQPGPAGAWDSGTVHQPRVVQTEPGWIMIYRGYSTGGDTHMALGYAVSADGLQWQRSELNPILTPKAVKGAQYFWYTSLAYVNDTFFLFWEIDKRQTTEIYLATHVGAWP